jgi:cobalt/nickel transport protein
MKIPPAWFFFGGKMKKGIFTVCFLATVVFTISPALAHFGMVIPSDTMVMQGENRSISITASFSHPFENIGRELVKPEACSVAATGKPSRRLGN